MGMPWVTIHLTVTCRAVSGLAVQATISLPQRWAIWINSAANLIGSSLRPSS